MAKATVVISSQDRLTPGLLQAKKSLLGFQNTVQNVGNTLKTALGLGSAVLAIKAVKDALTSSFEAFNEADRKYKQLKITLGNGEAFTNVSNKIKELSRITLSSKDDVEGMVSELAGLGKGADEINAISEAAVTLSNVTGKDLNSSMTILLSSCAGTTKELKKLIPEVGELTKEELAQGGAIDIVTQKFSELSKEMAAGDTTQHIKNIKDTVGDLSQTIGEVINSKLGPYIEEIDTKLTEMFDDIEYVIRYIGAALGQLPEIASLVFNVVIKMVERLFTFDTIKSFFTTVLSSLLKSLATVIENLSIVINHVVEFVVLEIQYIANNLYMELVNAIYDFFDSTETMFKDSWLGKLIDFATKASGYIKIGIGGILAASDIASGKPMNALSSYLTTTGAQEASGKSIEETTKAIKNAADSALENAAEAFKGLFTDLSASSSDVLNASGTFLTDNFSDILTDFKNAVDGLVVPLLKSSTGNNGSGKGKTTDPDTSEEEKTFLEKFATGIGDKLSGVFGATSEQWTAGASSAIDGLTSNLGEAGDLIKNLATNMATMGPAVGAIATAAQYVIEGLGEVLSGPLNEFVHYGIEPLKELGRVIGNLIVPVLETVMPLVQESAESLIGVFDSIGIVLKPIVEIIDSALTPVVSILVNMLKALEPVFKVFAKAFVAITGTIQYVIQTLQHWVATLMNWLAGLSLFGWHPFGSLKMSDPGSPGSYTDFIKNKWSAVDAAFEQSSSGTTTGMSIAQAGYQGATSVTINIYQQAPVVGSNGMREFASMIKDEFDNLNYYGVTA